MRKIENAIVAAVAAGDLKAAHDHLEYLLVHDRRRAWWALFRVAAAQTPEARSGAMLVFFGKTYIARRTGRLIGTSDDVLLQTLLDYATAGGQLLGEQDLTLRETSMLRSWLPARLGLFKCGPHNTPSDIG